MEVHFYIIFKNSNQFPQKNKHGNMLRDLLLHLVPENLNPIPISLNLKRFY